MSITADVERSLVKEQGVRIEAILFHAAPGRRIAQLQTVLVQKRTAQGLDQLMLSGVFALALEFRRDRFGDPL